MQYLISFLLVFALVACKDRQAAEETAETSPSAQSSAAGAAGAQHADTSRSMDTASGDQPQASGSSPGMEDNQRSAGSSSMSGAEGSDEENYKVAAGDTLTSIARKHGMRYQDIADWNDISNPNDIRVGQTLRMSPP